MFEDNDDEDYGTGDLPEDMKEFFIYGIIPNDYILDSYNIILKQKKTKNTLVSITIGGAEAQSIAFFLEDTSENRLLERPLTHDTFANFIEQVGKNLSYVVIDDIEDSKNGSSIVLSSMVFDDGLVLDARPSDSISMSLRLSVPIFISEDVIKEISFTKKVKGMQDISDVDSSESDNSELEAKAKKKDVPSKSELEVLQEQLEDAVSKEDYERAAEVKKMMEKLP